MAKPKKAKQPSKAADTPKAAKETERPPEPEAPPQPENIHAEAIDSSQTEPPAAGDPVILDTIDNTAVPSASNEEIAPAPSQEEGRNLDQDNGGELGVIGS